MREKRRVFKFPNEPHIQHMGGHQNYQADRETQTTKKAQQKTQPHKQSNTVISHQPQQHRNPSKTLHTTTMSSYLEEDEGEGEEVPQNIADLAQASAPSSIKGIRACKRCGILKTLDQFINEGCENCPFLEMVRYN